MNLVRGGANLLPQKINDHRNETLSQQFKEKYLKYLKYVERES